MRFQKIYSIKKGKWTKWDEAVEESIDDFSAGMQ